MTTSFSKTLSVSLLEKIRKEHWYRHGIYRDNLLFASSQLPGLNAKFFKEEGMPKGLSHLIRLGFQAYLREDEFEQFVKIMLQKIRKEKDYLTKYISKYREDNNNIITLAKKINKKQVTKLNNTQLAKLFTIFYEKSLILQHWLWSMEFLNQAVDIHSRELITQWNPEWNQEQIQDFLVDISYIEKQLPFQKEMEILVHLNKEDLEKQKSKLYKEYSWLNMNTWDGRPFTEKDYEKRIQDIWKRKKKILKGIQKNKQKAASAKKIIQNISHTELKKFLKIVQELIYLKTERMDIFTRSWFLIIPLVDEIAKRIKCDYTEFLQYTFEEISTLLTKKSFLPEKRKQCAMMILEDKIYSFSGNAYTQIEAALTKDYSSISQVQGLAVNKGAIRGKAKILLTDRDLYKLEKGDILISNLTNPNYNPAFEKINAVVTDEGGILCHSAIMAREFHLPCVVGTKIATKVFKDGDLVEVDANKGVVKLLKR